MKKLFIILGIVAMLLLAGCTTGADGKQSKFALDSFNGGDKAVNLEFGEQSPTDKIMDQSLQPFSVRILVENTGEYDIPENAAYIALNGFNPQDLGITQTSKAILALRGFKKQGSNVIPGGKQQVVFENLRYVNSVVAGTYPFKFYANVCYPYETKALARICVNGNTVPAIDEKAKICELEGSKEFANSGAPVKIANVVQYPYGEHSIQIQFDIVHKGTSNEANVYERGSIDSQCNIAGASASASNALFKRDKITYIVETGIAGLDCESSGSGSSTVQLSNNKYTVTCVQDTTGQPEHEIPATITLRYDYLDRISKTINVEHINR